MHPVLVDLGARSIGTYGVMLALAVLVAGFSVARAAARARIDVFATLALVACTIAGAFSGAWLTFIGVELLRTGSVDLLGGGGLVFFGAVPGGLFAAFASARWLRLDALRLLDLSIPGLASGHALGRIGCFFGGCCYGAPSDAPWAVVYTHPLAPAVDLSVGRHPTQLYEASLLVVIAMVFAVIPPARPGDGSRAALYLASYCVLRLVTETFRGDAIRGLWLEGLVSTSQLVAMLGLVLAALGALRPLASSFARE